MKDRSDHPSHHERTLLPMSHISLLLQQTVNGWDQGGGGDNKMVLQNDYLGPALFLRRERSIMVRWVVGSILHGVDPLSYFSFQPVLHDWCNKGRGMCYSVCGMVHIKEPLMLIDKSSLCGGSGFPFSLSEWSLTIYLTPYNRR